MTYDRRVPGAIAQRINGVMVSMVARARPWPTRYSICRSVGACSSVTVIEIYEGMVVGIHSRGNDLNVVNPDESEAAHEHSRRRLGREPAADAAGALQPRAGPGVH